MEIRIKLNEEQMNEIIKHVMLFYPKDKEGKPKDLNAKEKAILLRGKGFSYREIGKILSVSHQTANNYLKDK